MLKKMKLKINLRRLSGYFRDDPIFAFSQKLIIGYGMLSDTF